VAYAVVPRLQESVPGTIEDKRKWEVLIMGEVAGVGSMRMDSIDAM
jgi:hypothetical protein